jgi:uncharacterized membrane protein (UPF0127 family)
MKKKFVFLGLILFIVFLIFIVQQKTSTPYATIDNHTFFIEIAKTPAQQETGLAKYVSIERNFAMYFPFNHADYYSFWMKGMHFPIDILFLRNNKIVTVFSDIAPKPDYQNYIYKPVQPADAVLEISAGLTKQYGFKIGDTLNLHL